MFYIVKQWIGLGEGLVAPKYKGINIYNMQICMKCILIWCIRQTTEMDDYPACRKTKLKGLSLC